MNLDQFLISFVVVLIAGKLGSELAERCGQPAVVGELAAGIIVGSSVLGALAAHVHWLRSLTVVVDPSSFLAIASQVGVVLLLFEAGLDTDMDDLFRLGLPAIWVACMGVMISMIGGYALMRMFGVGPSGSLFIGAALAATSVGITARSFADLNQSNTVVARIVMGAAVADDVIGLVVLAVMSGLASKHLSMTTAARTSIVAIAFLTASVFLGRLLAPMIMRLASRMRARAALSSAAVVFCFILSILSSAIAALSPIIGAFAAGLVLAKTEHKLHFQERIKPVADLFIPIFFVCTGAAMPIGQINPANANGRHVLMETLSLFIVAAIAKVCAGLSVPLRQVNRLAVGVGMIPRGEVVLVFAGFGIATHAIDAGTYSAILLVVMLTTFVTPPLLKIVMTNTLRKKGERVEVELTRSAASAN